jgi:hypothetical protein
MKPQKKNEYDDLHIKKILLSLIRETGGISKSSTFLFH